MTTFAADDMTAAMVNAKFRLGLAGSLIFVACGPMNAKPVDSSLTGGCPTEMSGNANVIPAAQATAFSKTGQFLVQGRVKDAEGHFQQQPHKNENIYHFRVLQTDGLTPCSKDVQVTIDYVRTDGHIHDLQHAGVERNPDDSFTAKLSFNKGGNWEIRVHITDGAMKDDHVIPVNVPRQ